MKPSRIILPIISFLFFMAIATLHAFIVDPDLNRVRAFFHFLKHVEYILIFLLVFNIVQSRKGIRFLCFCGLAAAVFLALQSILVPVGLQGGDIFSAFTGQAGGDGLNRLRGVITETANIFGGYLMFHVLVMCGFFLEETSPKWKLILGACILIMVYPLLLTLSRSSYVGLLMGLVFLGFVREPKILIVIALMPVIALSLLPGNVLDRLMSIYYAFSKVELTPAWQARLNAWQLYIPTIIKNPFLGKGLYYIPPGEVDNEFVLRGVETGVFGLLSFLWVFWHYVSRAWFNFRQSLKKIDAQLNLGFLAGLAGMVFHALAATSFTAIRTAEPIYFFSGLILANYLIILELEPGDTLHDIHRRESEREFKKRQETGRVSLDEHLDDQDDSTPSRISLREHLSDQNDSSTS
ncbi:MAG: O-antigen ligase family protein [bacterium]